MLAANTSINKLNVITFPVSQFASRDFPKREARYIEAPICMATPESTAQDLGRFLDFFGLFIYNRFYGGGFHTTLRI